MRHWFRKMKASSLARARLMLMGPNAVAILSQADDGLYATAPDDRGVGQELRNNPAFWREELQRVLHHVRPDDAVLNVGTNIGVMAIPIAKRCKQVVGIEANPASFRLFEVNCRLHAVDNVRAINVAASDKRETLEFLVSRRNAAGSKRMPKVRAFDYVFDEPDTITVEACDLDTLLEGETFAVVVMDIEGSEYFALKGMQTLLRDARTLFIEFLPHHLRNVSGVTPAQLLALITPHFASLFIPGRNIHIGRDAFLGTLQEMFDNDEEEDSLIFSKAAG